MTDTTSPAGNSPPENFAAQALSSLFPHRSVGLKLLLVCFLALIMAIPAMFMYEIVRERTAGQQTAFHEVAERVGGHQSVLGPVLALPYAHTPDPNKSTRTYYGVAIAYAETGSVETNVTVEERKRGIHGIPVYDARMDFTATFLPNALKDALPATAEPIWSDARLYLGVSDARGIRDAIVVSASGQPVSLEPASRRQTKEGQYHPAPRSDLTLAGGKIRGLENMTQPLKITARMQITGAGRFAIGPFAKDTEFKLESNWPDPSFTGGTLPLTHTAGQSDDGFRANWRVPYIARGSPGSGAHLNLSDVSQHNRDMAVRFVKEANPYQSVERALKYAAMFVGFIFLAYFLFEITSGARAHPAQYVLVGLAQTIFYLLLLAFSEKIGFDMAFMIAATMTVLLTAFYASAVFRSRAYGIRALGVLGGIYSLIYILMRAQDHALLAGALASFAAIGLTMYMTRNIDWYGSEGEPSLVS